MKKYAYKIKRSRMKLGFDFDKKIAETENEWNQLGQQGWRFYTWGNDAVIFIKEIEEEEEPPTFSEKEKP